MCYGQILESGLRKARKPHRCAGCGRLIRPGVEYERTTTTGSARGEIFTSTWHKRCAAVADVTEPYDSDGCMIAGPREMARDYTLTSGWKDLLAKARKALAARKAQWAREKERAREARERKVTRARTVRTEVRPVPRFEEE